MLEYRENEAARLVPAHTGHPILRSLTLYPGQPCPRVPSRLGCLIPRALEMKPNFSATSTLSLGWPLAPQPRFPSFSLCPVEKSKGVLWGWIEGAGAVGTGGKRDGYIGAEKVEGHGQRETCPRSIPILGARYIMITMNISGDFDLGSSIPEDVVTSYRTKKYFLSTLLFMNVPAFSSLLSPFPPFLHSSVLLRHACNDNFLFCKCISYVDLHL